jgi:hypothetical protein
VGTLPLRKAVLEATGSSAASSEHADGVVGEHAERTAAVRDYLELPRKVLDAGGKSLDRDRSGTRDVASGVLRARTNVDHDHVAGGEPLSELVAADLIEAGAVAEIVTGEIFQVLAVGR